VTTPNNPNCNLNGGASRSPRSVAARPDGPPPLRFCFLLALFLCVSRQIRFFAGHGLVAFRSGFFARRLVSSPSPASFTPHFWVQLKVRVNSVQRRLNGG